MDTILRLAGIPIGIRARYDSLPDAAHEYETDETPAFSVTTDEQDLRFEREKSAQEASYEGRPCPEYTPAELESTAIYRKIAERLPEYGAFVFHGAAVAVGSRAYLFTAKSGTGKTTHVNLWLKNIDGSFIVNGDKPILRVIDGAPFVCGTPWMGKEGLGCPRDVPLEAICFLNRGAVNRIEPATLSQLLPRLLGQTYRPQNGAMLAKTVRLLEAVSRGAALYELFCNMDDEAANVAFGGMSR